MAGVSNIDIVKSGSDIYILSPNSAVFDINSAGIILDFDLPRDFPKI
jgi:hypothetical protein